MTIDTHWEETRDGYTRAVSETETCLLSPAGEESWPVVLSVELELGGLGYDTFIQRLKNSWGQLAIDYPHFTSTVPFGTNKFVAKRIDNESTLNDWLGKSFKVVDDEYADSTDFFYTLDVATHASLYYISKCNVLAFACPHVNCDCRGVLIMFDRLLSDVASGDVQINFHKNPVLTVNIEHAITGGTSLTDEQKQLAGEQLQTYGTNVQNSICDEPAKIAGKNGKSVYCKIPFTEEESRDIVQASKKLGVTVTAITYASLFESIRHLDVNKSADNYSAFLIVGFRDGLQDKAAGKQPIGMYSSVWPFTTDTTGTKMDVLKNVNEQLTQHKTVIKENKHPTIKNSSYAVHEIASAFVRMIQSSGLDQSGSRPVPSLSSAGKADPYLKSNYGPIVVKDFWEFFTAQTPFLPWLVFGYQDRIHVGVCYNDECYTKEYMDQTIDRVRQTMLEFAQYKD